MSAIATAGRTAADDLIASLPVPCPDCPGVLTSLGSDAGERPLIQCGACGGIFDAVIFAAYRQEA
jgi:hypothetical protein